MEARTDLKSVVSNLEDADSAAPLVQRRSIPASTNTHQADFGSAAIRRRRFLAATIGLGVLTIGSMARGWLASIAAPSLPTRIGNRSVLAEFANFDQAYATSGITVIQTAYATGSESDAVRILRWIRERKHVGAMAFLASCMTDPRTNIRWAAARAGLNVPPIALKPHLSTVQAAANAETNPAIQNLFLVLIPTIQKA